MELRGEKKKSVRNGEKVNKQHSSDQVKDRVGGATERPISHLLLDTKRRTQWTECPCGETKTDDYLGSPSSSATSSSSSSLPLYS